MEVGQISQTAAVALCGREQRPPATDPRPADSSAGCGENGGWRSPPGAGGGAFSVLAWGIRYDTRIVCG